MTINIILSFFAGSVVGILITAFMIGRGRELDDAELVDSRELADEFSEAEERALALLKQARADAGYWRLRAMRAERATA